MASLYEIKISAIDHARKTAVLNLRTIHPDAMYFSNNLGFVIRLIHDAAAGDSAIAKSFDAHCLFDDNWLRDNAKGYIARCELNEVRSPDVVQIMNNGKESYWRGDTDHASATMTVHFASPLWMQHLNAGSVWRSTAYPSDVVFADREPVDPANEAPQFSDDHQNSGGWLSVKSETLKNAESSWPETIFIPIYTEKSYRRKSKLAGASLNKAALDALLFQTVFALGRDGFKNFGVLVPQQPDRYGVISFSKGGYAAAYYDTESLLTLGPAEFDMNDGTKAVKFST